MIMEHKVTSIIVSQAKELKEVKLTRSDQKEPRKSSVEDHVEGPALVPKWEKRRRQQSSPEPVSKCMSK